MTEDKASTAEIKTVHFQVFVNLRNKSEAHFLIESVEQTLWAPGSPMVQNSALLESYY